MSEKGFQSYFMKTIPHGYRTALISGGGFPDALLIHGSLHSLVELKLLELGKKGDKKLKGLFKPTQPPWYANYLSKGGSRLFVVFQVGKRYGILHVGMAFVRELDDLYYSDLKRFHYTEHDTLKGLIDDYFS
jgi:hypothetical protein